MIPPALSPAARRDTVNFSPTPTRTMESQLTAIHELILKAKGSRARALLEALVDKGIPRAHAARAAQLAWRLDAPALGLRLLHPLVRPRPRKPVEATEEERAEYAQCLVRAGAPLEGARILESLGKSRLPSVLLYRAGLLISEWNYAESIPWLSRYAKAPGLEPYQRLVGKVNLAAALVFSGQNVKAGALLRDLLYTSSLRGFDLMLGRVLELTAENFLARKRWGEAKRFLKVARERLKESGGVDELFVRKYEAVVALHEDRERGVDEIRGVRAEASQRGHWETVRDCDRIEATATRAPELLAHVYFGTPYPAYRDWLLAQYGRVPREALAEYLWNPKGSGAVTRTLDLLTASAGEAPLAPVGSVVHRLLVTLAGDFYRPLRLPGLFAKLYPDRFFDPVTSPPLVHDATTRLRGIFREHGLPLAIEETNGFYRLTATAPFGIRITAQDILGERYGQELKRIRECFGGEPFSATDAAKLLGLPQRTVFRMLQQAREAGMLERSGKARATRYVFA